MIRNERVCDLCTSAVPNESPHTDRFSTLTLVGGAQQTVQSAFGRAAGIDLCEACAGGVVRVLTAASQRMKDEGGRMKQQPESEPGTSAPPVPAPPAETRP